MNNLKINRRNFVQILGAGISWVLAGNLISGCSSATATPTKRPAAKKTATPKSGTKAAVVPKISAGDALLSLIDGNQRFYTNQPQPYHEDLARRTEVVTGQKPIAAILTCSDSRVAPEVLFDQGLGDIFVVRTAGNVVTNVEMGSLEYAVEHLGAPLVVVLGHQKCGAVSAAVQGGESKGHIAKLIELLAPAVEKAKTMPGDLIVNAINTNILDEVDKLQTLEPLLAEAVRAGKAQVVGARYDLDSGVVDWMSAASDALRALFPKTPAQPVQPTQPPEQPTPPPQPPTAQPTANVTQPPPKPTGKPSKTPKATKPSSGGSATKAPNEILGVHIVQQGETLLTIGRAYKVDPYAIALANKIANIDVLMVGQKLEIPAVHWINMSQGPAAARQFEPKW
jgi:carbonic anhydrase